MTGDEISLVLQNAGLGPMILRRIMLLEGADDPVDNGVPLKDFLPTSSYAGLFLLESENYTLGAMQQTVLFRYPSVAWPNPKDTPPQRWLCIEFDDVYDDRYEKRQALSHI